MSLAFMSKLVMELNPGNLGDLPPISKTCLANLMEDVIGAGCNTETAFTFLECMRIMTVGNTMRVSITIPITDYNNDYEPISLTEYGTSSAIDDLIGRLHLHKSPYLRLLGAYAKRGQVRLCRDSIRNPPVR